VPLSLVIILLGHLTGVLQRTQAPKNYRLVTFSAAEPKFVFNSTLSHFLQRFMIT
jgi:hypothetical protein